MSPAEDSRPVARVLPRGLVAKMSRAWEIPAVFNVLGDLGGVPQDDRDAPGTSASAWSRRRRAESVDGVLAASRAWVLGDVAADDGTLATDPYYVQGAKGVDRGRDPAVRLVLLVSLGASLTLTLTPSCSCTGVWCFRWVMATGREELHGTVGMSVRAQPPRRDNSQHARQRAETEVSTLCVSDQPRWAAVI